jgi:hypothetical protein
VSGDDPEIKAEAMDARRSAGALALLRYWFATRDNRVTIAKLEAYRELVGAGIMYPVSRFASAPGACFRFTDEGWRWREEFLTQNG